MTNIPLQLRKLLKDHLKIGSLSIAAQQQSVDGTVKRAYSLSDGQQIESVMMPYNDGRRTACVSSQVFIISSKYATSTRAHYLSLSHTLLM